MACRACFGGPPIFEVPCIAFLAWAKFCEMAASSSSSWDAVVALPAPEATMLPAAPGATMLPAPEATMLPALAATMLPMGGLVFAEAGCGVGLCFRNVLMVT